MDKQELKEVIRGIEDIYVRIVGKSFNVEFYINDVKIIYFEEYVEIVYCNEGMRVNLNYSDIEGVKEVMEIEKLLKDYNEEKIKIDRMKEEVRKNEEYLTNYMRKMIDYIQIDRNYNYLEAKEMLKDLYSVLGFKEVNDFLKRKKEREYPEILGVHYFPEIKEINWLSEEEKIELDCELARNKYKAKLFNYDKKVIDFLIEKEIVEKQYIFACHHNCWSKIISEDKFNLFKKYWENPNSLTEEECKKIGCGTFYIDCDYDGEYEISSLDDSEEFLEDVRYKVIKEPDMTLDRL